MMLTVIFMVLEIFFSMIVTCRKKRESDLIGEVMEQGLIGD